MDDMTLKAIIAALLWVMFLCALHPVAYIGLFGWQCYLQAIRDDIAAIFGKP